MSSTGLTLSPILHDPSLSAVRLDSIPSLSLSPESILVYVTLPGSPAIPLRVLQSDSIASVKLRIQNYKGFVVNNQKIIYDGRELARRDCLVRDYGVSHGDLLHLIIRASDLRAITVKTVCGKEFKFQVEQKQNVGYIKHQIAQKDVNLGEIEDQKLVFDGEELDDDRLITDICKKNEAVIHLFINKSVKFHTKPLDRDFEVSIDSIVALSNEDSKKISPIEPVIVNPNIKLPPIITDMVSSAITGFLKGYKPVISTEGMGGAYFMRDLLGESYVAVFKPMDEEPMAENNPRGLPLSKNGEGLKRGTRVGEGALREVAAYILDHPIGLNRAHSEPGFSGVPPTALVRCECSGFFEDCKVGSLQKFVENLGSCEDVGPAAFPVEEVHKIAVLDMRLANADRHAGNILLVRNKEEGRFGLVPIDHGYCLPESFEDCTFEWLYWPQSRQPFDSNTLQYIKSLDEEQDINLLKFYGWDLSLECARVFRISTMLLKKGAERGLTPFDIGNIMCRQTLNKESRIEEIVREAMDSILPETSESGFLESVFEIMDRYLDKRFS